ncbi:MAG: peptide-methionine (S)-S-oxide reductase MsrA [Moraxellaceae bacterium]|nr:peptide-methionine (S)-S-oxide reductase MsrA [Moraxellaceae bacterium]
MGNTMRVLMTIVMTFGTNFAAANTSELATATFATGCFWCTEADFEKIPGVVSAISGYTGGKTTNPTYSQISSGKTGHVEAVQVRYRPSQVSYESLLATFWATHDYLDGDGQFCDRGSQYAPALFTHTEAQTKAAQLSKEALQQRLNQPIATRILPAVKFYPAEEYHQDYAKRNSVRYQYYRLSCGRDARIRTLSKALK